MPIPPRSCSAICWRTSGSRVRRRRSRGLRPRARFGLRRRGHPGAGRAELRPSRRLGHVEEDLPRAGRLQRAHPDVPGRTRTGFRRLENRVTAEIGRILGAGQGVPLSLSIVLAPVFHAYSVLVHAELGRGRFRPPAVEACLETNDIFQLAPAGEARDGFARVRGRQETASTWVRSARTRPSAPAASGCGPSPTT
ncbi:MAG: hypothetical protein MZV64_64595 [Ignavibacteriales bacterium]|nr:hypothetical protein [Ignavibacteriales bacterium]